MDTAFLQQLESRLDATHKELADIQVRYTDIMQQMNLVQKEVVALEVLIASERRKHGVVATTTELKQPIQDAVQEKKESTLKPGEGPTMAVLRLLRDAKRALTISEILSRAQHPGVNRNSLHTTLIRQIKQGLVVRIDDKYQLSPNAVIVENQARGEQIRS